MGLLQNLFGKKKSADVDALKAKGDIKGLTEVLSDKDPDVRKRAAQALQLEEGAIEDFRNLLKSAKSSVELYLPAKLLGGICSVRTVEVLRVALEDPESGVRREAATALGRLYAVANLMEPFSDKIKSVDANAYSILQALATKKEQVMKIVIATLEDKDTDTRESASSALKHTGVSEAETAPSQSYCFICSGNPSLIDAYNDLFKVGALAYNGTAGHYYASVGSLDTRQQEASKNSLPFVGQSYMGTKSTPVSQTHEVLRSFRVAASREPHIAFVSVDQTGISWVHKVYNELLNQAVSQGILPFEMFVTNDENSAQFVLGSFSKIS